MYDSPKFKGHALKVVTTIGVAVKGLDNMDELVPVLKDLGTKHVKYGVLEEHYPLIFGGLLEALRAVLGPASTGGLTMERREAW